jgi:hypothetical protein
MKSNYISENQFWDEWEVVQKSEGVLFEFDDVKDQPLDRVWTIVESGDIDDDSLYASPGFHIVNRIGFVATKKAWSNEDCDAVYLDQRIR